MLLTILLYVFLEPQTGDSYSRPWETIGGPRLRYDMINTVFQGYVRMIWKEIVLELGMLTRKETQAQGDENLVLLEWRGKYQL